MRSVLGNLISKATTTFHKLLFLWSGDMPQNPKAIFDNVWKKTL